jgi:hypothetical protein
MKSLVNAVISTLNSLVLILFHSYGGSLSCSEFFCNNILKHSHYRR